MQYIRPLKAVVARVLEAVRQVGVLWKLGQPGHGGSQGYTGVHGDTRYKPL